MRMTLVRPTPRDEVSDVTTLRSTACHTRSCCGRIHCRRPVNGNISRLAHNCTRISSSRRFERGSRTIHRDLYISGSVGNQTSAPLAVPLPYALFADIARGSGIAPEMI